MPESRSPVPNSQRPSSDRTGGRKSELLIMDRAQNFMILGFGVEGFKHSAEVGLCSYLHFFMCGVFGLAYKEG